MKKREAGDVSLSLLSHNRITRGELTQCNEKFSFSVNVVQYGRHVLEYKYK
jgi:hypothetical protein